MPDDVVIAVAGDVHFEGALRDRLADPSTALAPVTSTLAAADLAIVNLETSIGTGGRPEPGKRFTFQAPAAALAALAAAGVDVATMANNHALDYGRTALPSTFAAIDAARAADPALDVIGIGRDARTAFRPAVTEVGGTTIATLGATVAALDPTADPTGQWAATARSPGTADAVGPQRLLRAVARADATADVVVVYVHWGTQGESCPTGDQQLLAARLVERGADIIVGSHAHQLQGDGRLGPGYVAYGLGNYAWYTPTDLTGVLTLTVRPPDAPSGRATVTEAAWEPARIGADGLPAPLAGAAAAGFRGTRAELRDCAGLSAPS
ncbi:CapA family protein [uncultured Nocardioides sp.]|uniref:CapA family protein n=1 Tax=uncultured Nocardioides sp. TaxID=198441 RepID=UPI00262AF59A|nr:CapA family protein [uncultured Nocardioides sp.]